MFSLFCIVEFLNFKLVGAFHHISISLMLIEVRCHFFSSELSWSRYCSGIEFKDFILGFRQAIFSV